MIQTSAKVFYDGTKKVAVYNPATGKFTGDVSVTIDSSVLKLATPKLKFKNNKNAGKKASYTVSFKANKGILKEDKKMISALNKALKNKPVYFEICPADLSKAKRANGKLNKDGTKVTKVTVEIDGKTIKLGKKDYTCKIKNGDIYIVGLGNFTGEVMF